MYIYICMKLFTIWFKYIYTYTQYCMHCINLHNIYIYIHVHMHKYIYIYIVWTWTERLLLHTRPLNPGGGYQSYSFWNYVQNPRWMWSYIYIYVYIYMYMFEFYSIPMCEQCCAWVYDWFLRACCYLHWRHHGWSRDPCASILGIMKFQDQIQLAMEPCIYFCLKYTH